MINNVVLVGRLTKDPDLRYTSSGSAVTTFTLAVNRSFTNQGGEREADFINCVIWRKPAETLANYTKKGSLIGAVGRIQTRNYENQQGQRVYVTEVVCDNFQMLETKPKDENKQQPTLNNGGENSNGIQTTLPGVDPHNKDSDPFGSNSQINVSDADLPF